MLNLFITITALSISSIASDYSFSNDNHGINYVRPSWFTYSNDDRTVESIQSTFGGNMLFIEPAITLGEAAEILIHIDSLTVDRLEVGVMVPGQRGVSFYNDGGLTQYTVLNSQTFASSGIFEDGQRVTVPGAPAGYGDFMVVRIDTDGTVTFGINENTEITSDLLKGLTGTAYFAILSPVIGNKVTIPNPPECPLGSVQIGGLSADIAGCGLEVCDARYNYATIDDCFDGCLARIDCESFTWAPLDGDKNHPGSSVCTLYNSAEPNQLWGPEQIMCKPSYFIGPDAMGFYEAKEYCQLEGAELATITNSAERDEVVALCKTYDNIDSRGCWIGLQYDNNQWSWIDGSSLGYGFDANGNPTTGVDPWYPGEPNNSGGVNEDCVHVFENQDFDWNDAPCSDQNHPICN